MNDTAESKMFNDSRARLLERHPMYRVLGFDMTLEIPEFGHDLAELLRPVPRATHVLLTKFVDHDQPQAGIRLAVFQYAVTRDSAEFLGFDEPSLTDEWKIRFDQMFREHVRRQGEVLAIALRALRKYQGDPS